MSSLSSLKTRAAAYNNLLVVVGKAFLGGLNQSMIGVVFQPFVLSLGASMAQLGFLASLGGFGGLIPTLVAPWGGWIADQRGRRLVLLGASVAAMGAYVLYTAAGWSATLALVVPAIILLGISTISQPANSALVGESVHEGRSGSAYSLWMFAATVPGIAAPLMAGLLAVQFGYTVIFPIALASEVLSFILVARYLRETRPAIAKKTDWGALFSLVRRAWIPPKEQKWFFIAVGIDMFAWGMGFGLLYGLLTKEYGFSAAQLGVLSAVSSLTWAVTALPIGRLIDRFGAKVILVASESLGPPLMLIWMTQSQFEVLAASMVIFALTASLWVPARNTYVSHAVAPAERAEMFGRLAAFSGIVGFPAAFIGGFVYDQFGFAAPFIGNLIFSALALVVLIFLVHNPKVTNTVGANGSEDAPISPTRLEEAHGEA